MSQTSDSPSFIDKLLHPQPREYTKRDGNVMYLDDNSLKRPLSMPLSQKLIALALVVAGILIGLWILNNTVYESARQAALASASVETNLEREASIASVPNLASLAALSDDDIIATMQNQGFSIYNATTEGTPGITIYKLPSDVSEADAALLYVRGISNLTASQATLLLNGSWSLGTSHESGNTIVVRWADFKSTSADNALSQAMNQEGIDASSVTDSGTDDSGNTYRTGTLEANGTSYTWRASAIDLDKMYSIQGMPEVAYYVGFRLTENA